MKSQKYNVGDTVVVAKFKNCVFGVDPNMRKYIGQHVHITRAEWSNTYNAWHYSISEDRGNWCGAMSALIMYCVMIFRTLMCQVS